VLGGYLADGWGRDQTFLHVQSLVQRVDSGESARLILALTPKREGGHHQPSIWPGCWGNHVSTSPLCARLPPGRSNTPSSRTSRSCHDHAALMALGGLDPRFSVAPPRYSFDSRRRATSHVQPFHSIASSTEDAPGPVAAFSHPLSRE